MKLSSPNIRSGLARTSTRRALTTESGYRNSNGQVVIAATGAQSTTQPKQRIYRLRCEHCAYEYGCNGLEIHQRLCPNHQGGVAGEPLREPAPTLNFEPA